MIGEQRCRFNIGYCGCGAKNQAKRLNSKHDALGYHMVT